MEKLGQVDMDHTERQVVCISQDSFYRELTPAEKVKAEKGLFNFDHPDAFNNELILTTLREILLGNKCEIPVYDYRKNSMWDHFVMLIDLAIGTLNPTIFSAVRTKWPSYIRQTSFCSKAF